MNLRIKGRLLKRPMSRRRSMPRRARHLPELTDKLTGRRKTGTKARTLKRLILKLELMPRTTLSRMEPCPSLVD